MHRPLVGKIALVTGAAQGLGWAVAHGMARAGATVILVDHDGPAVERRAHDLAHDGFKAHAYQADVADTQATRALIEEIAHACGRLDVLVNNAGIMIRQSAFATTEEAWDRQHAVNLRGLFFCAQAVARVMARARSGVIINISSTSAWLAAGSSVAYYASKAGIIILTRDLAGEWGPLGIRVNCIAPGGMATAMQPGLVDTSTRARADARALLGHTGRPEDLVASVIFLASDDAAYINGATLVVDGGETFWRGPRPGAAAAPNG